MKPILAAGSAALLLACIATAAPPAEEALTQLRTLPIEAAADRQVTRDAERSCTIVRLVLRPAPGSAIHVEVRLPDEAKWNGRFLGLGNGGAAGRIDPAGLERACAAGYAVATTDLGTAPNPDSGIGNPEVWRDFGFRATHLMTVAAKRILREHYGRAPEFSYFRGSSTGGQQALQEAQRYPEDYDGIVATLPAHCRTPLHAYFLWNHQILARCPFTRAQEAAVIAAANDYFAPREVPVAAGRFVSDPRCTPQDIEAVIALARKKEATLTDAHADALRRLFDGPRHAVTGERIFDGIPLGASLDAAHGHLYLFRWVFGAEKPPEAVDFAADIDAYTAALASALNAEDPDLAAFARRGGKLIVTTGSADSVVPPQATIDYYERVVERFGGLDPVRSFFRLYLIPGMAHGGGPGVNQQPELLEAIRAWRENGIAPDALPGRRVVDGRLEWEFPLYPYPWKAGWDAATSAYRPVEGPRGGVKRVSERFRR